MAKKKPKKNPQPKPTFQKPGGSVTTPTVPSTTNTPPAPPTLAAATASEPSEFKFPILVEQTIQGIVDIVFQCLTTWWWLLRHPLSFMDRTADSKRVAHPFTFLALSAFISIHSFSSVLGIFSSLSHGTQLVSKLRENFSEFSVESLITHTLPTVLYVVVVALVVSYLAVGFREERKQIRKAICYAAGFVFLSGFILTVLIQVWSATLWIRWEMTHYDDDFNPPFAEVVAAIVFMLVCIGYMLVNVYMVLVGATGRVVSGFLVTWILPAFAAVALCQAGSVTSTIQDWVSQAQRLETFQRGEGLIHEVEAFVTDGHLDPVTGEGTLVWSFTNAYSKGVTLMRSPVKLTIDPSDYANENPVVADLIDDSCRIVDWSGGDAPYLELELEKRGWMNIDFEIRDRQVLDELLKRHQGQGEVPVSCRLEMKMVPMRELFQDEPSSETYYTYAMFPLKLGSQSSAAPITTEPAQATTSPTTAD